MNVIISISILSLLLAFLASKNSYKYGLELCFILLTFIGAIHYMYGNDYLNYMLMFEDARYLTFSEESLHLFFRDPGWIFLCLLFRPFGFFALVIFLNIVQNYIYYRIIKIQVERKWWWLAVFIYVFSTNYYLLNFSMMRQGLAISLIVASFFLMEYRRYVAAAALVIFASFVHATSIIAVPFLLVIPFLKNIRFFLFIYVILFLFLFFVRDSAYSFFLRLSLTENLNEYSTMYQGQSRLQFGIGFLIDITTFLVIIIVSYRNKSIPPKYIQVAGYFSAGYLLMPLQSVNLMVGRLGYYFSVSSIVAIPYFYKLLKKEPRIILLSLFLLIKVYRYYLFFNVGPFAESYSQSFTTIFGTPWR